MSTKPPFQITNSILSASKDIAIELGVFKGAKLSPVPIKLRRDNKIKTIHSSLAIEGNTLSLDEITGILEGKKILGPKKDIQEVNNAIKVYESLHQWNALSKTELLKAHRVLMAGLIQDNGKWRSGGVGIFKGKEVSHVAPPAKRVPQLIESLFEFIKIDSVPWLIKACIFHYELEFIHPFADGNGRMGRLWQQLLLMKENPIFEFISVESLIKEHQAEYYKVLEACDKAGDSTLFIEFSLNQILSALSQYTKTTLSQVKDKQSRLEYAKNYFQDKWFSRKEYIILHKSISTATASRDLINGTEDGSLIKKGSNNQVIYKFSN